MILHFNTIPHFCVITLGWYGNSQTHRCEPCPAPCRHCTLENYNLVDFINTESFSTDDMFHCLSCDNGYNLLRGSCVEECGNGMAMHTININDVQTTTCLQQCPNGFASIVTTENDMPTASCLPCDSQCLSCIGFQSNCTRCSDGRVLQPTQQSETSTSEGFSCQRECDAGFYVTVHHHCLQCQDSNCIRCYSGGGVYCEECDEGYLLELGRCVTRCSNGLYAVDDKCLDSCPAGYRGEQASGRCIACGATCRTCVRQMPYTAEVKCTSCFHNYYLLNDKCVQTCPSTHIAVMRQSDATVRLLGGEISLDGSLSLHYNGKLSFIACETTERTKFVLKIRIKTS